jgi:hypothetical protein
MKQVQAVRLSGLVRSLVIVSMVTGCSFASTLFTSSGGGADRTGDDFTLGTGFTVNSPGIIVTALGIYDVGGAFTTDHQIALWDHTAGDTLVASATFLASNTNSGTPAGFLYVSISPLLLVNGDNYVLGAFYPSLTFGSGGDHLLDTGGSPGTDPNFGSFVSRFDTHGTFQEPLGGAGDTAYIGPNLQFTPAPEPSTVFSIVAGLAGIALLKWRRS